MFHQGWTIEEKAPQTTARLGRKIALPNAHFHSVTRNNFKQVVFAMLLGEEEPRLTFLEDLRSDQTADRAVPLGHM
jgi:hypothetical protein